MRRAPAKQPNLKAFEDAREAVIKLETLSRLLTKGQLETLEVLFDERAVRLLSKSAEEAKRGLYDPIETILS